MHGCARFTDAELVARLADGHHDALAVLFDRHHRRVRDAAHAVLRDPPAAEDVAHEVFLAAWRGAASYRAGRASVPTWLCGIAHNRAIDALRRNRRHQRRLEALAADGPPPPAPSPQRLAEAGEARRQARAALARLPDEQRRVVELVYFSGLSQSQVADADGIPLGTVKGRMRLALRKLRPELAELAA